MQKDDDCAGGSSTGSENGFVIVNDSKGPSSVASSFAFISSASSSGTGSHNESPEPEPQAEHEIELQQSTETEAHAEANTTSTISAALPVPVQLPVTSEAVPDLEKPPSPSPLSPLQQQQLSDPPLSKPRSRFVVDVDCTSSSSISVAAPSSSIENQHPVDPQSSQRSAGASGSSKIQPAAVKPPSRHTQHGRDDASLRDMVRQLRELSESTGMPIRNESGQRLYGPPNNWEGSPPPKGCEVFVGKLPRHILETELVPLFSRIGPIYQLRMMVDFHGFNRGFCFVQYTQVAHAQQAIHELNDHEIIPSRKIGVVKSVNNTRLFLGGIPTYLDEEQIFREMDKICVDVVRVIICPPLVSKRASTSTTTANTSKTTTDSAAATSASNTARESNAEASTSSTPGTSSRNQNQSKTRGFPSKNRGYAFVEFANHKSACLARRKMFPKTVRLWGRDIHVDWAVDGTEIRNLHVSNLDPKTSLETIEKLFNSKSQNGVETVKFFRNYTFVHFFSRDQAIAAKTALDGTMVDGRQIQINWAKPSPRLDPSFQQFNQNDSFNNYGYYYDGHQNHQNQNQRFEGGDRRYFQQQNRNWNQNYGYDQSAIYYGRNQGNVSNPTSYSRNAPGGGANFGLLGQFPYHIKQTGSNRTFVPEHHTRHRNKVNQNLAQDKNKNKNPDAKINPTANMGSPPAEAQRKSPPAPAPLTSTPKSKCRDDQAQHKPSPSKQPLLPLPNCPPLLPIPVTPSKTASASARPPLLPLPLPLSVAHPAVQNVHHKFDSPYHPPNHHQLQNLEQHWQAQQPLLPPPFSMEQLHYPPPQGNYQNQRQHQHQSPLPYPYLQQQQQQQDHYQYPQLVSAQSQSQTRNSSPNVSPTVIIRPTYDGDLPLARTMSELNRDWVSEVECQNHQQQMPNPQAQGQFQLEGQRQIQNHSSPVQDLSNLCRSQGLSEPIYAPFYFPSAHNPNQLIYGCTLYISGAPGGGEIQQTTKYNYGTVEDAKNAVAEETCFDLRRKLTIAQFAQLDLNAAHGHRPSLVASSISMPLSAAPAPALAIRPRDSGGFFRGQATHEGMSTNRNSNNSSHLVGTGMDTRGGNNVDRNPHAGQTQNRKPFSNWPAAPNTTTSSATGGRAQREIGSAVYRNQQKPPPVVDANTNGKSDGRGGAENIHTENEGRCDIQGGNSNANHSLQLQNDAGAIEAETGRGGAQRGRNDYRERGRRGRGGNRGGDSHSGRGRSSQDYGRWVNPNSAAQGGNNGDSGSRNERDNGGGRGSRGNGNPSFSRGRPARR